MRPVCGTLLLAAVVALLAPPSAVGANPWGSAETVSRSAGPPSAAITPAGTAVIAWTGPSQTARRGAFGARGTARAGFGAPFGLRAQDGYISSAAVQASAGGDIPIAYRRYVPCNHRVESATVRPNGSRTRPVSLSGPGSSAYEPRFAAVAAGSVPKRPVLTWWRRETDRAQIARAVDGRLLAGRDVTIRNAVDARYAQLPSERLVAVSTDATSVFIQPATADDSFEAPMTVASGRGPFRDADIAAGRDGSLAIAWREYDGRTFLARAAVLPAGAESFQAPITLSAADERAVHPRVTITETGAVRVAYISTPSGNDRSFGRSGPLT